MTDKEAIIAKIKKCLNLAKSSNEHEAAVALRQAQKLMEQHGVTDFDIETADITEESTKAGAARMPARWEGALAKRVASAFGCDIIFVSGFDKGTWSFVGAGPAPEIVRYAFEVLFRQIKRARATHIKTALRRCGPANRTRRADLYCEGWVISATATIAAFANSDAQEDAIAGYIEHKHDTTTFLPRDRNAGRNLTERDMGDFAAGRHAGKDAQLNRGVGGQPAPLALE